MDAILLVIGTAITAYSVYEIGYAIYDAKFAPPGQELDDPLLGKKVVVCRKFSSPGVGPLRTGAIELNGVIWEAETNGIHGDLDIGDSCVISGRVGLRLVIKPEK